MIPPPDGNAAFEVVSAWMDRWRPKEERWRWINDLEGVEHHGCDEPEKRWFCGIYQPYYHDSRINGFGATPDAAMIALAQAVQAHKEDEVIRRA